MYWHADDLELHGIRGAGIHAIMQFTKTSVPPGSNSPLRDAEECSRRDMDMPDPKLELSGGKSQRDLRPPLHITWLYLIIKH